MENDDPKIISVIITNNNTSINVFKLQYKDQNVNNNFEYQKWKKLMLKKYGNNSMEFKCNKDKILFYSKYNDCLNEYYYKCKCPICNNYICYFCSFSGNDMYSLCCTKHCIFKAIFYNGPKSMKEPFDCSPFFAIFPGLNILVVVMLFFMYLYIGLIKEKCKNSNTEEQYVDVSVNKKYILNAIIIILIGLAISISFLIIFNYLIVLLILISIPFKFAPIKYYLGVIDSF